uniref:Uncharacterized protein n=1 Tax=Rhizophora mucronata TaxID=61149 RepID=A0A2P2J4H0_RHIMU
MFVLMNFPSLDISIISLHSLPKWKAAESAR